MRRATLFALAALVAAVAAPAGFAANYVVLYKQQAVPADSTAAVQQAGGTVVATYPQIGVVVASSDSASFRDNLLADSRIQDASSTQGFAVHLRASQDTGADAVPAAPVSDTDPLSGVQWDMAQIHTPGAHAVTGGSPSVLMATSTRASTTRIRTSRRTSTPPTASTA